MCRLLHPDKVMYAVVCEEGEQGHLAEVLAVRGARKGPTMIQLTSCVVELETCMLAISKALKEK